MKLTGDEELVSSNDFYSNTINIAKKKQGTLVEFPLQPRIKGFCLRNFKDVCKIKKNNLIKNVIK